MGRRRQAVTIRHVAADAGVSLQTVSRVINNGDNVRPQLREKVQEAIERLGYVPSIAAQRMSGSRSYLLLAINDRDRTIEDWRTREGTDWIDQMLLGGMLKCAEHGFRLIFELVDTHADNVVRELGAALAALRPDGVILTPPHSDNPVIVRFLAEQNIPFARIGSRGPGEGMFLLMDDYGCARMATQHLLELGHTRIAFIAGSQEYALSQRRIDGWREALEAAGVECTDLCAQGDFSHASGTIATEQLLALASPPTAIIAGNDQMAFAALQVLNRRGLKVPRDMSLISFDNTPLVRFTSPPLTAVDQPIAETTARAAELLIAASKDEPVPADPIVVPGRLVERESTARPA